MGLKKLARTLSKYNTKVYNLQKASEECMELALALQQMSLKPKKVLDQAVIDEIGDVKIRIKILEHLFDRNKIQDRVNYKKGKFNEYLKAGKYKNI
jgi:hypothetical protein